MATLDPPRSRSAPRPAGAAAAARGLSDIVIHGAREHNLQNLSLRLPRQTFNSPAQMEFARRLSYNPWHCIPEHRPLGNQSRARRRMYYQLSTLRHTMNAVPHYEPTGDEVFE